MNPTLNATALGRRPRTVSDVDLQLHLAEMLERLRKVYAHFGGVAKVASACGCSTAKFYSWASGDREPNLEGIAQLALATGVDLNWLVLGKGRPFPGKIPLLRGRTNNTNKRTAAS